MKVEEMWHSQCIQGAANCFVGLQCRAQVGVHGINKTGPHLESNTESLEGFLKLAHLRELTLNLMQEKPGYCSHSLIQERKMRAWGRAMGGLRNEGLLCPSGRLVD